MNRTRTRKTIITILAGGMLAATAWITGGAHATATHFYGKPPAHVTATHFYGKPVAPDTHFYG